MSQQKPKGKKRPRGWHHGRRAGQIGDRHLQTVDAAFERAAQLEAEIAEVKRAARAEIREWRELYAGLDHVAPAALRIEVPL